jgi:23S rRNA (guanosine2251-2'-O)-methyltransferase
MAILYGINSVLEALRVRGRAFDYIAVSRERQDHRVQKVVEAARQAGVPVRLMPREQLERLSKTTTHQGVVAVGAEKQYVDVDDILRRKRGAWHFLLVLDGVEDPHNLGAILRSCDAAGADGVVLPERRAVGVNETVAKASAGASETVPVAKVTNVNRAIEDLKEQNIWTVGLDERGTQDYTQVDYKMDCALILGAEGHGLHEQVRKKCDFLIRIPMLGSVPSLNVSVAAAVVMFEAARQRKHV